jgi:hypothetical protein
MGLGLSALGLRVSRLPLAKAVSLLVLLRTGDDEARPATWRRWPDDVRTGAIGLRETPMRLAEAVMKEPSPRWADEARSPEIPAKFVN